MSHYLDTALKHNLDYRRCGMGSIQLHKKISANRGDIVLVVQVLTTDINCTVISPERSCDYFIEYIINF